MKKDELKALEIGARVRWTAGDHPCDGTVTNKYGGSLWIAWDDGAEPMCIGWRSAFDRDRARNLELLANEEAAS